MIELCCSALGKPPSLNIESDKSILSEGEPVTFSIVTKRIPVGTAVTWNTLSKLGTVNTADFTDGLISGTVFTQGDVTTFVRELKNDFLTEGQEKFSIEVTIQTPTELRAESGVITINDTSITQIAGQAVYTQSGTFIVPENVRSISALGVGSGGANKEWGAGGGGALSYRNNITVTPKETLKIEIGLTATSLTTVVNTRILRGSTVLLIAEGWNPNFPSIAAKGGKAASSANTGGGNGGLPLPGGINSGGGGAGGYSGNGGNGGSNTQAGTDGAGGGGGGSGSGSGADYYGGGGGVGLLGEGASGKLGNTSSNTSVNADNAINGGGGGSGGQAGGRWSALAQGSQAARQSGGLYGGGGAGSSKVGLGGDGAVRIIWGTGRAYPATNTHDV